MDAPVTRPRSDPAGEPIPGSPVEGPRRDDLPPAVPVAVGRRWWVIVGAFTVAVLWIASGSWPFDRALAPTAPAASDTPVDAPTAADAVPAGGSLRSGNEVLTIEGPDLVAVDPDSGASRTLLDRGGGTDPLPTAAGGEVVRGKIVNAAWSPDGRWVAFDGPRDALWVMDAEMEIRRLGRTEYVGWVWSPTDAQLAMVLDSTLRVVDAPTGRMTDLGEVSGDVTSSPVWSPDGTQLLLGARGGSISSVNVQSGERSFLARLPGGDLDSVDEIEWSPDGAHVAVMNDLGSGGGRLYVMNADGSGVRVLLDDYEPAGLAWSPDGESLAYAGHGATGVRLWTVSQAEGSPSTVVASGSVAGPVWSPDGGRIGFAAPTVDGPGWFAVEAGGVHRRHEIDELTYLSWRGGSAFPS